MARKPSQYFLDMLEEEQKHNRGKVEVCEIDGCSSAGEFKAPKSKGLNEYHSFCLKHVEEYNSDWDFFSDMPQSAVENQMYNDMMWDRPTWKMAPSGSSAERFKQRIYDNLNFSEKVHFEDGGKRRSYRKSEFVNSTPESNAMEVMGLDPPLDWPKIKKRYRDLAKIHHPDKHGGDNKKEEEILKEINMAYSILKVAHQKYEALEKK